MPLVVTTAAGCIPKQRFSSCYGIRVFSLEALKRMGPQLCQIGHIDLCRTPETVEHISIGALYFLCNYDIIGNVKRHSCDRCNILLLPLSRTKFEEASVNA